MKKNYAMAVLCAALGFVSKAQVLTPFTGSNSIPTGTTVTLCTHAGCGSTYGANASGYTVIYASPCVGTTITGTYDVESCCDDVNIFAGVGTGGTLLQNYAGTGTATYVAAPGQIVTIQLSTDGSVQKTGYQFTVTTGPALDVNNGVSQYTICNGVSLNLFATGANSYTWTTGANTSSVAVTPSTSTVYTVTGSSTTYTQCALSKTVNVSVLNSPVIALSGSSVHCGGTPATTLQVTGLADSYMWNTGATTTSITVSPLQATTYSVTGSFTNGCTTTRSLTVYYSPSPSIGIFTPTNTICEGQSINMFASGANLYSWTTGTTGALANITLPSSGTVSVIGTDSYGCQGIATVSITVNSMPTITVSASKNIVCAGETFTLNAGGAATYTWSGNSFYSFGSQIMVVANGSLTYSVTGTDANGCTNTNAVNVTVNACLGVNELSADASAMSIYPNPTTGLFTVEFGSVQNRTIDVMDVSGRTVMTGNSQGNKFEFNIQNLAAGIYYVRTKTGDSSSTTKLVKQ